MPKPTENTDGFTAIRVDWDTHAQLKALAGETPIAKYVRELIKSIYLDNERELLSEEIRKASKELGENQKITEMMLEKASINVLRDQVKLYRDRLAHPERGKDHYIREEFAKIAARVDAKPEQVQELFGKLAQLTPESLDQLIQMAKEYEPDE